MLITRRRAVQSVVRHFSTSKNDHEPHQQHVKVVTPITKLQHIKFDLAKILQPNMMPLLRQNILNRKALYADADLVLKYYE